MVKNHKKKYSDYKKSGVKIPILALFLNSVYTYIVFGLVALLSMGFIFYNAYNSMQEAINPPEKYSPYQEVNSVNTPGMAWASSFITTSNQKNWVVSESTKPIHPFDVKVCPTFKEIPQTMISTYSGSGSGIETRIQLYGTGQSAKSFTHYTQLLSDCGLEPQVSSNDIANIAKIEKGFIINMGDVILSVYLNDVEKYDEVFEYYLSNLESTLRESKCVMLKTVPEDSTRSFFYDKESYKGLNETVTIDSIVDIDNLPNASHYDFYELNYLTVDIPESPLPKNFPNALPKEVERPEPLQSISFENSFSDKATYNIKDLIGAGCGWEWAGQKPPVYNDNELLNAKNSSINKVQEKVNNQAESYITNNLSIAFNNALILPKINDWNIYVKNVNNIHSQWLWLDAERDKLYYPWHSYVELHKDWEGFDARKAEAVKKYDDALEQCRVQQEDVKKWEEKYGELARKQEDKNTPTPTAIPTPSPSASDKSTSEPKPSPSPTVSSSPSPSVNIPPKPSGCTNPPIKPSIIDEKKPDEPQPPLIPEGVTIPDSWAKI